MNENRPAPLAPTLVSRRAVSRGIMWATPAVAVAASAPAFAASQSVPPIYFTCPTTYDQVFTGASSAAITSAVAQGEYDPNGILAANDMDGTTFGVSFDPANVVPVPLYNADGSVYGSSSGLYLLPGCGTTTCVPDVENGFTLPKDGVVLYDGYGARRSGRIISATPTGCSPSTNTGSLLSWNIQTDVLYNGSVCKPLIGPENQVSQMSIPLSLVYLNGLDVVNTNSGGSCCLYLNLFFDTSNINCTSQPVKDLTFGSGWSLTSGLPAAPAPQATAPHVDKVKTPAGADTKSFTASDNVRILVGGGFTDTTSVTWAGVEVPFTVLDDNRIQITLPTTGAGLNGIYYDIVVTDGAGSSPTNTNTAITRY